MNKLSPESALKLQKILSKRIGHELSREELELAYSNLMDFAFALIDLTPTNTNQIRQSANYESPLAFTRYTTV
ncbi:hypothetical protein HY310_00780 [Candidatus Microgenomates bacterium]|nr:hypothetical protein [Candidatus Microgenomates bacterium]